MTFANHDAMSLNELRRYVLTHREDGDAFQLYVDRSKAAGRIIAIELNDTHWETTLENRIQQTNSDETESN